VAAPVLLASRIAAQRPSWPIAVEQSGSGESVKSIHDRSGSRWTTMQAPPEALPMPP